MKHDIYHASLSFYLRHILLSPIIYILAALGLTAIFIGFSESAVWMDNPTIPLTAYIYHVMSGGFSYLILLIISFAVGELVWASRDNDFNLIDDALPVRNISRFLAMFTAVVLIIIGFLLLVIATGIVYQLHKGYYHLELGLYFKLVFGVGCTGYLPLILLAFLAQTFIRQKYIAHFIFVFLAIGLKQMGIPGVKHGLLTPFYEILGRYSDMNGLGGNIIPHIWFSLYWLLVMLLFTGCTVLCGRCGTYIQYFRTYLRAFRNKSVVIYHNTMVALILCVAGYIFYNTNILNEYITDDELVPLKVEYEKTYKHYERENQPKIEDIRLQVDIYPEKATAYVKGVFLLRNVGDTPIDSVLVTVDPITHKSIFVGDGPVRPASDFNWTLLATSDTLGIHLYRLHNSLSPGDTLSLHFELAFEPKGFSNYGVMSPVLKNGTFISDNHSFPVIGYNSHLETTSHKVRKRYGLPQPDPMPEPTDAWGLSRNYHATDAHWLSFEATVSTSSPQIALASGELQKAWSENNRNYYTYKNPKMHRFFAFISAHYEVLKETHNGVDLEVYYHPAHTFNIGSLMHGMKAAMTYYAEQFGEYPYNVLRIAELPHMHATAQAFSTLTRFLEYDCFIADIKEGNIDTPFYVATHEIAHQWWGHQTTGGQTKGAAMLSESLSEYSATMVFKHSFSDELYREFLRFTWKEFIEGRSKDNYEEEPLTQVTNKKHIYYNKGLLMLNGTSRLIGEETLNATLGQFLQNTKYTANPYTNTAEFMAVLDTAVPDSLKAVIDDMYNKIVWHYFYDTDVGVTQTDGHYTTTLKFTSTKREYDLKGRSEVVDINEWIEIGLTDAEGALMHVEKVYVQEKDSTFEIITDFKPSELIFNPYYVVIGGQRSYRL